MEGSVINIVRIVGRDAEVKHALMMLCSINPNHLITKAISKELNYTLEDNSWELINWDKDNVPFDFKLVTNSSIKFKTHGDSPYDTLLMLSEYNPNVYITVYYTEEDFGVSAGIYKFIEGEEIDYYSPKSCTKEATELSLSIIDDDSYLFTYINDLEEEELQDGINGSDEVINTLIVHIYKNKILTDLYPIELQEYLLNLAIEEEDYEYAAELKKVLDSAY